MSSPSLRLNAHFFREASLWPRLQLQTSSLHLLGFSFPATLLPPSPVFPGGEAMGFLPACSLGIAFPNPQPPFDPCYCSRMKTHFDHRDMSLPLDNRSCCFQTIQLPDRINCPSVLLITRLIPSGPCTPEGTATGPQTLAETPQHVFRLPPGTHVGSHGCSYFPQIDRARAQNTCSRHIHAGYGGL